MNHARCFLCGARIAASDLRYEGVEVQIVTRRYECPFCSTTHEVTGFVGHAASTTVRPTDLVVSRSQAAEELSDLASAVANEGGLPVPMAFLADFAQACDQWGDGNLSPAWAEELQRIRGISRQYRV